VVIVSGERDAFSYKNAHRAACAGNGVHRQPATKVAVQSLRVFCSSDPDGVQLQHPTDGLFRDSQNDSSASGLRQSVSGLVTCVSGHAMQTASLAVPIKTRMRTAASAAWVAIRSRVAVSGLPKYSYTLS
jgi:hypothetical protein